MAYPLEEDRPRRFGRGRSAAESAELPDSADRRESLLVERALSEPPNAVRRVLTDVLPWTAVLPGQDFDELLEELAQAATGLRDHSPVAVVLAQWRHTAEVYADPGLLGVLTREPEGDFGPAPTPYPI
ncbi:hypothetical protein GCM10027605_54840 [Micromonospora zhanjiangensis]